MPTDNQENHSQNESENSVSDNSNNINGPEIESSNTAQNQVANQSGAPQRRRKKKNTIVEVVKFPNGDETNAVEANIIARNANRVSIWSVSINFLLFLLTLALALISYLQYNSSNTAAEIAKKTFEADTAYNNKVYKQSRLDADSSDKRENKRDYRAEQNLRLQNEILSAQIKAFQESQNEFYLENRPVLGIFGIQISKVTIGEVIKEDAFLTNTGKSPAVLISAKWNWTITSDSSFFNFKTLKIEKSFTNIILSNGANIGIGTHTVEPITTQTIEGFKKHIYYYLKGMFVYTSLLNKKKKYTLDFLYRISVDEYGGVSIVPIRYISD